MSHYISIVKSNIMVQLLNRSLHPQCCGFGSCPGYFIFLGYMGVLQQSTVLQQLRDMSLAQWISERALVTTLDRLVYSTGGFPLM